MPQFALYNDGNYNAMADHAERPADIPHKKFKWYPVIREFGADAFEGLDVQRDAHVIRKIDPATLPPPVPSSISDRQFFHILALNGSITQEEALAAVKTGEIPATILAIVNSIPDDTDRFNATMLLSGAVTFERNHPLTVQFGTALGFTSEQIDDLFRAAAQL